MIHEYECPTNDLIPDECLVSESQNNLGQFDLIPQDPQSHCDLAKAAINYVIAEMKSAAEDATLNNLVSQLDEVADQLETAQEFVIAKMQLALDSSSFMSTQPDVANLDSYLAEEESELCAWSINSAKKLIGYCLERIEGLPAASFDTDGLGNVVVNWEFSRCDYQWTIVKSNLKWPMIQVYEYFEDHAGGDANVLVWFNAASLFKSFEKIIGKHGLN